jgi:uncharacterized repeat protein (TIGR03803 family)
MKTLRISCMCGGLLSLVFSLSAQTFTTLHSFDGTDGAYPTATLVQGTDGNLYGTTQGGGANLSCIIGGIMGCGTVFKITPSGTLTTIYNFCSQSNCTDGASPFYPALVQGPDGNFYGTTLQGGANSSSSCVIPGNEGSGCGTVFKITPGGRLTTVYNFCSQSNCTDGSNPAGGLVLATDGNFYGTTGGYGNGGGANGVGTVFKITASGTLTTLHSFDGTDGLYPGTLVQGTNGNFYGTTGNGGASGVGTVFSITPGGTLTTLYNFCSLANCTDGANPAPTQALVQGSDGSADGNFYGTTQDQGGDSSQHNGTLFKITAGGTLTTLYAFGSGQGQPYAGLIQATDRHFYGTTYAGGGNGQGAISSVATGGGTQTTLYNFCSQAGCADGSKPQAALVQDTNGTFYGTTDGGGASNLGTVFSLSLSLKPFVETQPTSGKVGAAVKILGTNLTGTTSVSFQGTPAKFTVVSSTEITTIVPTGAKTGKVSVVTPGGTLISNVNFRVEQ